MNIDNALNNIGKLLVGKAKAMAKADKTYARGNFANSFKYVKDSDNTLTFFTDEKEAPYARAVIEGSSPAKKTLANREQKYERIIDWAKAKGIRPRNFKTGKFMSYKQFSYLISRSIAKRGIIKRYNYKGSNLVNRLFDEVKGDITIELKNAFNEEINKEFKIIFENAGNQK